MVKERDISVITGAKVTTRNGLLEVQDVKVGNLVLTNSQVFKEVKGIKKSKVDESLVVHVYGLESFLVDTETILYVRDLELTDGVPLVSWPYWLPAKDLDVNKHLTLSPFNPQKKNPYKELLLGDSPGGYFDEHNQLWLQVKGTERKQEAVDSYMLSIEGKSGIAVECVAVK